MKVNDENIISFEEYRKIIFNRELITTEKWGEDWQNYWETIMQPLYILEYWKIINNKKIRDLVEDIFDRFDFESVEEYMKSVNWTWQDNKTTPKIKQLKDCILGLIGSIYDHDELLEHNPSTCETGGFRVEIYHINSNPYKIRIEFQKQDGTKFEEETKISIIRKKKLEVIERL